MLSGAISLILKYLFKYLTKGHDKARVGFYSSHVGTDSNSAAGIDEIDEYIKCRSVFFHTGRRDGLHYYIYTIVFILFNLLHTNNFSSLVAY